MRYLCSNFHVWVAVFALDGIELSCDHGSHERVQSRSTNHGFLFQLLFLLLLFCPLSPFLSFLYFCFFFLPFLSLSVLSSAVSLLLSRSIPTKRRHSCISIANIAAISIGRITRNLFSTSANCVLAHKMRVVQSSCCGCAVGNHQSSNNHQMLTSCPDHRKPSLHREKPQ